MARQRGLHALRSGTRASSCSAVPICRRGASWFPPRRRPWSRGRYYDPAALPNGSVALEESTQTAQVRLPVTAFVASALTGKAANRPSPTPSVNAAFVNYSMALQHDSNGTAASGLLDSTVSGQWGLLANSVLVGQSAYQNATGLPSLSKMVRLDSYYRYDDPDRLDAADGWRRHHAERRVVHAVALRRVAVRHAVRPEPRVHQLSGAVAHGRIGRRVDARSLCEQHAALSGAGRFGPVFVEQRAGAQRRG